ncbi:MAG TPA: lipoate--protein ligase [Clostridiales bacterium]|nr:lipoate--protein ligase [Clostridiales bacterium]
MIKNIKYIISKDINPYRNLALEEYLLETVDEETCILYLWQNKHTVVIGKNQNPWKECKVKELERSGGSLARRLSGGGAVYHDLGNLNFTILLNKKNYDLNKQLDIIIKALKLLNINAVFTGRNDITVDSKKFSGNAFYTKAQNSYHHGTILINVDIVNLSKYLNVAQDKLKSKGVKSVKSRVTNLIDYSHDLTIDLMKIKLIEAFSMVYGLKAEEIEDEFIEENRIVDLYDKFSSWDWKYGRKIEFQHSINKRYKWGNIDLNLSINEGRIKECIIYSDAMEVDLIEKLSNVLLNCVYSSKKMIEAIEKLKETNNEYLDIIQEIQSLIEEI